VVKYRQRHGWTHRDVLRLSHPEPREDDAERKFLFDFICGRDSDAVNVIPIIDGYKQAQTADVKAIPGLITRYGLSWEMLPDAALTQKATWEALLDAGMPPMALIRNLPRLTNLGIIDSFGSRTKEIAAQLTDSAKLVKARVHPMKMLIAQTTYAAGRGVDGKSTWKPVSKISDALDAGFYTSYGAVESTGQNFLLALDVSGSMGVTIDRSHLSARAASSAMALVTANAETNHEIIAFTSEPTQGTGLYDRRYGWNYGHRRSVNAVVRLDISPRQRIDDVIRKTNELPFGNTDCALPMLYASRNKLHIDTFVIYTDSETWYGDIHPFQALTKYREEFNPSAKLIVVGLTSSGFTIADPSDNGSLDVAGFDGDTPQIISGFAAGA
jgi:60 kDa SS-A/Ro ribonucleoprotein